uniref:Cytochrome c oxidase subunit 2 n=1 Tax=Stenostomum sthenum TaxID=1611831 RepID=A0A1Z1M003_9PLAT|nr:cytochrome c oxidase subunit II [Stenostomum sthenum]ARW59258.1 cytochrome c oxidase subunit II [Stenostomum sthenum]
MFFKSLMFQDSNSLNMLKLTFYHDKALVVLVSISLLVAGGLLLFSLNKYFNVEYMEYQWLEFLWTVLPAFILLAMAFPSMKALYYLDEIMKSVFSVKVIAHQWYWSYEYPFITKNSTYDSFMKQTNDLDKGEFRLLDTTTNMLLFNKVMTQVMVTSSDVLHSWTVPVLGIKMDAMPGRISQAACFPLYSGVFYGQCSEICGVNHSFMPIKVEVLSNSELMSFKDL